MPDFTPPHHAFAKITGTLIAVFLLLLSLPASASVLGFVEHESTTGGDYDVAIRPDGKFVYCMNLESVNTSKINVYSRNPETGAVNAFIEVTAPSSEGTITNTAGVSADQRDTAAGNDRDDEDTTVSQSGGSVPAPMTTPTPDSGSSGGGGSLDPLSLLLMAALLLLLQRRSPAAC